MPAPSFVNGLAPPTIAPDTVNVELALFTDIVDPPVPSVKLRSVDAVGPVICSVVPPASTRFAAALLDCPMLLGLPPFASVLTESTPPEIVVGPVYVLAVPFKVNVPAPVFVRLSAPPPTPS